MALASFCQGVGMATKGVLGHNQGGLCLQAGYLVMRLSAMCAEGQVPSMQPTAAQRLAIAAAPSDNGDIPHRRPWCTRKASAAQALAMRPCMLQAVR